MKGLEDDAKRGIVISTMKTTGLPPHQSHYHSHETCN